MVTRSFRSTCLLAKSCRMVLHPDPLLDRTRMYKHLSPRPPYQCSMKRDLSSERLASTDPVAACRKPYAHAHAGSGRVDRKENCTGAPVQEQLMSWKFFLNFLKYFLDYCMGYGRTRETNLTRRKKMGFDLYSLGNHKTEDGEYFRNNVWWWRRLASFVCEHTGVIAEEHKYFWQSNDGHEVDEQTAKQIAKQLKALIKDGTVSKAIIEVEQEMEKAEKNNKFVDRCHEMLRAKVEKETNKSNLAPADYPKDDHDTWDWIQSKYSYGSSYPFTMENVEQFIEFCEQSNGFRIC
jgi:hypothetical protein